MFCCSQSLVSCDMFTQISILNKYAFTISSPNILNRPLIINFIYLSSFPQSIFLSKHSRSIPSIKLINLSTLSNYFYHTCMRRRERDILCFNWYLSQQYVNNNYEVSFQFHMRLESWQNKAPMWIPNKHYLGFILGQIKAHSLKEWPMLLIEKPK